MNSGSFVGVPSFARKLVLTLGRGLQIERYAGISTNRQIGISACAAN